MQEQNRQYELLLESQKQQRARLEEQCQYGVTSSMVMKRMNRIIEKDFQSNFISSQEDQVKICSRLIQPDN